MELVKRIIVEIYSNGESVVKEEVITPEKQYVFFEEKVSPTPSWTKYNLITYSKDGDIYKELQGLLPDQSISVELGLGGPSFIGKIDKEAARITSLSALYNYLNTNNKNFIQPGKIIKLLLDPESRTITLI